MFAVHRQSRRGLARNAARRAGNPEGPDGLRPPLAILRRCGRRRLPVMKTVEIFTDGACKGNPGPGGWGALLRVGRHEKELSGGEANTTNNRMELTAAIRALEALIEPCNVVLHSDSKYVLDGITRWVHGWQKNGWKNASKQPVR